MTLGDGLLLTQFGVRVRFPPERLHGFDRATGVPMEPADAA